MFRLYRFSHFARFEIMWLKETRNSKSCKKCQYCDKELQYFRGSIGYANLSQVCWKKLFLHPWQVAHIDIFVHMFLPVFNIELFLKLKVFCSLSAVLCLSYILINTWQLSLILNNKIFNRLLISREMTFMYIFVIRSFLHKKEYHLNE